MKVIRPSRQAYIFTGICLIMAIIILPNSWRHIRANYIAVHQLRTVFDVDEDSNSGQLYPVSVGNEKSPSVLTITGWAHLKQGDTQKAIANLSQASLLDPKRVSTLALLGDVYFDVGDKEKAVFAWENAGADFRLFNRALLAHDEDRWAEAIQYLLMSIQVNPESNSSVYSLLGDGYRFTGQLDEAAGAYRKAASLESNTYHAAMYEGLAAGTLSAWEEAISWYQQARFIDQNQAEPYYQEGHLWYWEKGDKEKSISLIKRAVEIDPTNPIPYIKMIQIFSAENEFEMADFWFGEGISKIPDNTSLLYFEAKSQVQRGNHFEAVTLADRILEQNGAYHLASHLRGNAYMSLSQPADAVSSFEKAVSLSPNNASYRIHLAQALLEMENPCRALEEADQALLIGMDYIDNVEAIRTKAESLCNP